MWESLIIILPANRIAIVWVLLVLIICLVAIIKSIILALIFLNRLQLLYNCQNTYDFKI